MGDWKEKVINELTKTKISKSLDLSQHKNEIERTFKRLLNELVNQSSCQVTLNIELKKRTSGSIYGKDFILKNTIEDEKEIRYFLKISSQEIEIRKHFNNDDWRSINNSNNICFNSFSNYYGKYTGKCNTDGSGLCEYINIEKSTLENEYLDYSEIINKMMEILES